MSAGRGSLGRFVVRRTVLLVPVLVVIAVFTFALAHLAPSGPADLLLGEGASAEQVAHLNAQWGLDQPLLTQFGLWAANILHGDLGESIRFGEPVLQVIGSHLGPTLSIAGLALLIVVAIGIPLGLVAGYRRGSVADRLLMGLAFLGVSLPEFWVAMLLVLGFGVHFGLFPISGYVAPADSPALWIATITLPAIALAIDQIALLARMVRDSVITTSGEAWVTSLRSRGLGDRAIVGKHQLKSAAVAAITVIGNSFAGFLTGAVVVEIVFNIQGFGWLTVQSALQRDYQVLQGAVLLAAIAYVAVNLLVDLLYAVIDPRIRAKGA
jgi:peptide/nickel transport system permease protein